MCLDPRLRGDDDILMKVLYFGTPEIAVPTLQWLIQHTNVVGVVCRPDEPVGRGYKITAPPTKVVAEKNKIPVFQPSGPWTAETISALKNLKADIGIAVAYGRIMPESIFNAPHLGCINIHYSLLPKYRGAAPMQWALVNGETKTGVTAFWLEAGLDSGPIFHQKEIPIAPTDRLPELRDKLVPLGVEVLADVMRDAQANKIIRSPQGNGVTLAPLLKKEMGNINWSNPAEKIVNLMRGLCEWPGVSTTAAGKRIKVWNAVIPSPQRGEGQRVRPEDIGAITEVIKEKGFVVQTGEEKILITEVQPEGKKRMSASAYWLGAGLKIGDKLG